MAFKTEKDVLTMAQKDGQYWSDYDKELARRDPDAGLSIYTAKQNYLSAKTDADKKYWNRKAESIRRKNGGYTAGGDGSGFMKDDSYFNHQDPYADRMNAALDKLLGYQEFTNPYQGQIDQTLDKITGRDPFSYDAEKDPMFQQYRKTYLREGQRANEDTMGNYAAMTGGMPSTAAVNAASQAQDYYNAKMADKIPELYQLAYQMYADEGNNLLNQLSAMRGLGQDALSAWGANQQLAQSQLDAVGQMSDRDYNRAFGKWSADHQVNREAISDSQWASEHRLNAQQRAQQLMMQMIQSGLTPSHETIMNAAWNDKDAAALSNWYKEQHDFDRQMTLASMQGRATGSGGRSGGGRSGGGHRGTSKSKGAQNSGDAYKWLIDSGATDYGTAYERLLARGYNSTEAKTLAEYFEDTYYPAYTEKQKKNPMPALKTPNGLIPWNKT